MGGRNSLLFRPAALVVLLLLVAVAGACGGDDDDGGGGGGPPSSSQSSQGGSNSSNKGNESDESRDDSGAGASDAPAGDRDTGGGSDDAGGDSGDDGGDSGERAQTFCEDVKSALVSDDQGGGGVQEQAQRFKEAIAKLQKIDPPEEIAKDWNTVVGIWDRGAAETVDLRAAQKSSQRVAAYMREECNLAGG
jgi:hypothetical protein